MFSFSHFNNTFAVRQRKNANDKFSENNIVRFLTYRTFILLLLTL